MNARCRDVTRARLERKGREGERKTCSIIDRMIVSSVGSSGAAALFHLPSLFLSLASNRKTSFIVVIKEEDGEEIESNPIRPAHDLLISPSFLFVGEQVNRDTYQSTRTHSSLKSPTSEPPNPHATPLPPPPLPQKPPRAGPPHPRKACPEAEAGEGGGEGGVQVAISPPPEPPSCRLQQQSCRYSTDMSLGGTQSDYIRHAWAPKSQILRCRGRSPTHPSIMQTACMCQIAPCVQQNQQSPKIQKATGSCSKAPPPPDLHVPLAARVFGRKLIGDWGLWDFPGSAGGGLHWDLSGRTADSHEMDHRRLLQWVGVLLLVAYAAIMHDTALFPFSKSFIRLAGSRSWIELQPDPVWWDHAPRRLAHSAIYGFISCVKSKIKNRINLLTFISFSTHLPSPSRLLSLR